VQQEIPGSSRDAIAHGRFRQRVIATGFGFPEGPSAGSGGRIYVAEMAGAQVSYTEGEGIRRTLAAIDGSPGATAVGPDGAIYVTNNRGRRFVDGRPRGDAGDTTPGSIDRITSHGDVDQLYDACGRDRLRAPNDLVFDAHGNIYFTDPGNGDLYSHPVQWPAGHIYRARFDGTSIERVATGYNLCNGIAVTADGTVLLVCETLTSSVWAHRIHPSGAVDDRELFARLPGGQMPDGCCLDSDGDLLCAAVGSGTIVVFDPSGRFLRQIPVEDPDVTNVAFAASTLLFTEGRLGRLSAINWPVPGMQLHGIPAGRETP
jgi:gluconolactonase